MKQIHGTVVASISFVGVLAFSGCEEAASSAADVEVVSSNPVAATPREPLVAFEPPMVDFGAINAGSRAQQFVEITNIAGQGIEVVQVRTDCGCLSVMQDEMPFSLAAGESMLVRIQMSPSSSALGPERKEGRVSMVDPAGATWVQTFEVHADVEPASISVIPSTIIVKPGEAVVSCVAVLPSSAASELPDVLRWDVGVPELHARIMPGVELVTKKIQIDVADMEPGTHEMFIGEQVVTLKM